MSKKYAYIRVSSADQNEARQLDALEGYDIPRENIYIDKQSGKDFDRPQYKRMVRKMKKEDLLYIKSIDRLGRDYQQIIEQWGMLTRKKQIDIKVLDMPLLDTTHCKDLLGTFISDMVLQLLSYVAENERINIKQRQAEGIAAAKARGVRFGRPEMPLPENFTEVCAKWLRHEIPIKVAGKLCGMSTTTFHKKAHTYRRSQDRFG